MNFQRICYKNCRVAFRLVLQFTANLLGSRKRVNTHSHMLLVFAPTFFFILFMYFDADNIHLTDKISLHRTYWLVFIGGDIDYFLPSIISVSKYTAKMQIPSAQKPRAFLNELLRFFCCPKDLQETAEPGKMRLGSFYSKSTKIELFVHFLIATSGYNS